MNGGASHKIHFFDAEQKLQGGKKPCTILIIGKRNSGKTTVVASLAKVLRNIPSGVCCSCTEDANAYWSNHIPGLYIHGEYTEDITQNLIEMQRRESIRVGQDNVQPCFAIYDDIMYDASFARQKTTRELFMNGRHFKISLLLTAQYCMDLPPALRTNIDFVFILKDPIRRNRQRLYDNFAGIFPSFDSFCEALDQTTENYECMVIDNTTNSNKLTDIVYYYKGTPNEKFKMGCKAYRRFARKRTIQKPKKKKRQRRNDGMSIAAMGSRPIKKNGDKKKKKKKKRMKGTPSTASHSA
jgi:energy-coupling factor transporter ATP-binding protein EcfA2